MHWSPGETEILAGLTDGDRGPSLGEAKPARPHEVARRRLHGFDAALAGPALFRQRLLKRVERLRRRHFRR